MKYFRIKKGRWQEVSKAEWERAFRRKGARADSFSKTRTMTAHAFKKKKLIEEWQLEAERSRYLWKGAAKVIVNILKNNPPSKATRMLRQWKKGAKGMAISAYYERAAKQIAELRRKRKN